MMEFPYGIADFRTIREQGLLYVDRTSHIRDLERLGRILVFLRPRRFGKSLWLQTLASYYDLRLADEFDELFGGLDIGREPTPLRNGYFVLQWNLANVDAGGSVREITEAIRQHVRMRAEAFVTDYEEHLPRAVAVDGNTDSIIESILNAVRQTPYKLYVLIDEYDNFVNDVMVQDVKAYHELFGKAGPYKQLFKAVKTGTEGRGIERVFVTGVAPVALNDLTSGFNNSTDVSHAPALTSLCGFRSREIRDLLEQVAADRGLAPEAVEYAEHVMRTWYNGYRFHSDAKDLVYNPTNAFYFLRHLCEAGEPPEELHDRNLRNDRSKLVFLAQSAAGAGVIERLTEGNDEVMVELMPSFSADDLTEQLTKDRRGISSMLYYMGMLTRTDLPFKLRIPNLVVRRLFLDRLLGIYLPADESAGAREVAMSFFQDGDLGPLLDFLRRYGFFDFLFEFKIVHRNVLGKKGEELKAMDETALRELPEVVQAFTEAQNEVKRYRAALLKREGPLDLRTFVVVAVGLERMLGEEIAGGGDRTGAEC